MPQTHERTFRVRHYECDAYGHLNGTNYLRYMQETAFDAAEAGGFGVYEHQKLGRVWYVRQSGIEYLRPLAYNDTVRVKTWIESYRRADLRRVYEFWDAAADELVARAYTDWIYLDSITARPLAISEDLLASFFPEGLPERTQARAKIPPAPSPPEGAFHLRRRVEWRDIDPLGHVNNAAYLAYAEDCGVQVVAAFGWPMARCNAAGFGIVLRRHDIEYHRPAELDDGLVVSTWVSDFRKTNAIRHYLIKNSDTGELLVRVRSRYVWIDLSTNRLMQVPDDFREAFSANVVQ
jgi:acyl-CoA thioester hydrolase